MSETDFREQFQDSLKTIQLVKNLLCWAIGGIIMITITVTVWVVRMNDSVESLKTTIRENSTQTKEAIDKVQKSVDDLVLWKTETHANRFDIHKWSEVYSQINERFTTNEKRIQRNIDMLETIRFTLDKKLEITPSDVLKKLESIESRLSRN